MKKSKFIQFATEVVLILIALIFVTPLLMVLLNSFKTLSEIYASPFAFPAYFSIDNYIFVWNDMNYMLRLFNSSLVTFVPIPFVLFFSSLAAYKLCRTKTKLSAIIFSLIIVTMLIPFHVFIVPFFVMVSFVNMMDSLWALVIIYIGFFTPFTTFLFHGFIKAIHQDIEDSARIDGCGNFGVYFHIILPNVKPIAATATVLIALALWNDFFLPLILISSDENLTLPLMAARYNAQFSRDWHRILPAMILLSVPIFVAFGFLQKYILDGIAQGAVKG